MLLILGTEPYEALTLKSESQSPPMFRMKSSAYAFQLAPTAHVVNSLFSGLIILDVPSLRTLALTVYLLR